MAPRLSSEERSDEESAPVRLNQSRFLASLGMTIREAAVLSTGRLPPSGYRLPVMSQDISHILGPEKYA